MARPGMIAAVLLCSASRTDTRNVGRNSRRYIAPWYYFNLPKNFWKIFCVSLKRFLKRRRASWQSRGFALPFARGDFVDEARQHCQQKAAYRATGNAAKEELHIAGGIIRGAEIEQGLAAEDSAYDSKH